MLLKKKEELDAFLIEAFCISLNSYSHIIKNSICLLKNQSIYNLAKDDFIQRFENEQIPAAEEEEEFNELFTFSCPNKKDENNPNIREESRRRNSFLETFYEEQELDTNLLLQTESYDQTTLIEDMI